MVFVPAERERVFPEDLLRDGVREAMLPRYARAPTFRGIPGRVSTYTNTPPCQSIAGYLMEGGNPYCVIHAVAFPGSLPSTSGALVS